MDDALEMVRPDNVTIWCVFDMDNEQNTNIKKEVEFQTSIELAESKGLKVAWSNDAFELWILLHFQDVDASEKYKCRTTYYEELTAIFSNLPEKNERLLKALSHASFNYKQDLKSERNFKEVVIPELGKSLSNAIERAEKLEEYYTQQGITDIIKQAPSTKVHRLVKELLKAGKKMRTNIR